MSDFNRVFGGYNDSVSGLIGFNLRYPKGNPALNLAFIKEQLISRPPDVYINIIDTPRSDGSILVQINVRRGNVGEYYTRMNFTLGGIAILGHADSIASYYSTLTP
jgi:hypothetical protein